MKVHSYHGVIYTLLHNYIFFVADCAFTFTSLTQLSFHVGDRKYCKKQNVKTGQIHAVSTDQ